MSSWLIRQVRKFGFHDLHLMRRLPLLQQVLHEVQTKFCRFLLNRCVFSIPSLSFLMIMIVVIDYALFIPHSFVFVKRNFRFFGKNFSSGKWAQRIRRKGGFWRVRSWRGGGHRRKYPTRLRQPPFRNLSAGQHRQGRACPRAFRLRTPAGGGPGLCP